WSTVAKRGKAKKPVTAKRREAIVRGFNLDTGEQGYEYVYIHRSRRYTRMEVRRNLRVLGIDAARILDVAFPARGIIGLLIHVQFKASFLESLERAKVQTVADFDPLDPAHLGDPRFATASVADREVAAMRFHSRRCLHALNFVIDHHKDAAVAVAKVFAEQAWITEEDLARVIAATRPKLFERPKYSRNAVFGSGDFESDNDDTDSSMEY
ncbi:hypothetical protein BDF20DRAFT_819578, partial [Mycotypha africana]|uniref:uncharacterized protein n=1 Tax=Mycotypha africana TaxID=64632 RepID=UPI0023015018